METTPTWLEVAHCAGSRFVFIVLSCTSPFLWNPTTHTRTQTTSSSSALSCLSLFPTLGLSDTFDILPPVYPATPPPRKQFLVSLVFLGVGVIGDSLLPVWGGHKVTWWCSVLLGSGGTLWQICGNDGHLIIESFIHFWSMGFQAAVINFFILTILFNMKGGAFSEKPTENYLPTL